MFLFFLSFDCAFASRIYATLPKLFEELESFTSDVDIANFLFFFIADLCGTKDLQLVFSNVLKTEVFNVLILKVFYIQYP